MAVDIISEEYYTFPGTNVTICYIMLADLTVGVGYSIQPAELHCPDFSKLAAKYKALALITDTRKLEIL